MKNKNKYKILFVTITTIILIFLVEIQLFANELPLANANFEELKNFAEGHMDVNDKIWKDVAADLAKAWHDTAQKEKNSKSSPIVLITKEFYKALYQKKSEELTQYLNREEQTVAYMQQAYKKIPNENALYAVISTFIKSDSKFNNLNNFNTVKLETLKKWKEKYDNLTVDWYEQDGTYDLITARIKNLEGQNDSYNSDSYINKLNQEYDHSENVAQKKIDEGKKILLKIQTDNGIPRTDVEFTDVLTDIDSYIPTDEASDGRLESKVSVILTVITNIGMILAVLMVAIIGVKYMLGSVEEKSEYKEDMIPYLVGACLLFGITVIVKVLQQIGQSINNI